MCLFKTIHILLCACCINFVGAKEICAQQCKLPSWESDWDKFEPPGDAKLGPPPECERALEVLIHNQRENFTLTLLANPFIKDGNCSGPAARNHPVLRKFHTSYPVIKDGNKNQSIFFGNIFTGCYYVEMTNTEGKKWLWEPVFFNRTYHYYNTMLNRADVRINPEEFSRSTQLKFHIEIPLTCLSIRFQLFEVDHEDNCAEGVFDFEKIPATQDCIITYNGGKMVPLVECSWNDTRPKVTATTAAVVDKSEGWQTLITLDRLKKDGAIYRTKWKPKINNCIINYNNKKFCDNFEPIDDNYISYGDLTTWASVCEFVSFYHDLRYLTNNPGQTMQSGFWYSQTFRIILYILLGVTITAILVYWMSKYAKVLLGRKHAANNFFVSLPEIPHDQEANHILLIYAYDSPPVMRAMKALRNRLQQISQFPVHDLYSDDEFNIIIKLGATGWVENLLRDGSKVVWVDTPQFRSVLNDNKSSKSQPMQHKAGDFRDEAVPYAVNLATNLFQNATTQYCCHFVVRLEGLEVEDGNDDPLLVVSPYVRYYIPEQLPLLCEHLVG